MGSSVVKHGYQNYGWANYNYGGITELTAFSDPWNLSRSRAFGRLGQEAELAGADAVIGIELTTNSVSDSRSDVEYVVFGTAVRETTLAAGPPVGAATVRAVRSGRRQAAPDRGRDPRRARAHDGRLRDAQLAGGPSDADVVRQSWS